MRLHPVMTFLLGASLSSLVFAAPAGDSLTLDQALNEGLAHSPKVQKAKAAAEEMSWKKVETYQGFLPTVNLEASHLFDKQYEFIDVNLGGAPGVFPNIIPSSAWQVSAKLPLFEGFQSYNRYKGAKFSESAAERDYSWTKFQTEQEIKLKFYQALAAQKLQAVAEQNVTTLSDHFQQTQALRRGGAATSFDVLRVEVQLNEAKSEVLKAEDDVVLAKQRLIQAMGAENDLRLLSGDLINPDDSKIKNLKLETLQKETERQDIKALQEKVLAADHFDSAAGSYWVPHIFLAGNWISYNNRTDSVSDSSAYRWAYNVGIYLNWNLFDGMASIAKSQESLYEKLQVEKSLRMATLQSKYDFDFWKRRFLYSSALYRAKLTDVEKAQESVRLARESFRAGARTSSEVLDAELDLFRARAGVVNSQISSAEAYLNLETAAGRTL